MDDLEQPLHLLPLEQLIAANLQTLFPGMKVTRPWAFRVTRDADVEIREDEADDLMDALQERLRQRRFGQAVRLEIQAGCPAPIRDKLRDGLHLDHADIFEINGLMAKSDLARFASLDLPELKWKPFVPRVPEVLLGDDLFAVIRNQDVMLHHPYDSFAPVVEFVRRAANDPSVVAIKQTLYRTNGDSPIVKALEEAVNNGKQVAAVIELKARFDEENNIVWAQRLEEVGVHVVYGVPGLKTHCKLALVVREEGGELRRYAHISSGNYNSITARIYTDLGLLTANEAITADVADVFNQLTGFAQPSSHRRLLVAPRHMKDGLIARIREEAERALSGLPAEIIMKCNAITDTDVIGELASASQAGVSITLLVRGICCLLPGLPGKTENIIVRSVVGRFLEHSRVYWFFNGGSPIVYFGSADLMDRNLQRRVEVLAPIEDPALKRWMRDVLLQRYLDDTQRTRAMRPDGSYDRLRAHVPDGVDVQEAFLSDTGGGE